ncbi:MAG: hypothetical protein WAW02_05900 [Sideroxyarcus sp.]
MGINTKGCQAAVALSCFIAVVLSGCGKNNPGNAQVVANARQFWASDIDTDRAGNLYVADAGSHIIRRVSPSGAIATLAGAAGVEGSADGSTAAARFNHPSDVAIDSEGNVYVVDSKNCTIRKITSTGIVTTVAGAAGMGGYVDGIGIEARFNHPGGIAVDAAGNVYVADGNFQPADGNNGEKQASNALRKITPEGVVTTLAGNPGKMGSDDGVGSVASFRYISGIAIDTTGSVYVADSANNNIRKITSTGLVTTLTGSAGQWGSNDGSVAVARFSMPSGIGIDRAGNYYVSDLNYTVRKITPQGLVTTLAGTAGKHGSDDGMGVTARFNLPGGIATDSANNIYVVDFGSIRKITPAGVVTTLAGTAQAMTPPKN